MSTSNEHGSADPKAQGKPVIQYGFHSNDSNLTLDGDFYSSLSRLI